MAMDHYAPSLDPPQWGEGSDHPSYLVGRRDQPGGPVSAFLRVSYTAG